MSLENMLDLLKRAEVFVAGFEGDELQDESVEVLLHDLRAAVRELGWKPWEGGERRLPETTRVAVLFACGVEDDSLTAGDWDWTNDPHLVACGSNIVAYRIIL